MGATIAELTDVAHAHAAAEAVDDFETVMDTLDDDPLYELQPVGPRASAAATRPASTTSTSSARSRT